MKGFDYATGETVDWSIPRWRTLANDALRKEGFVRIDRKLGETFIYDRTGLIAEIYTINLPLERRHAR